MKHVYISLNRKRLFTLINDLPTIFEVVTERKPVKDKPSMDSGSKSRLSSGTKVKQFNLIKAYSIFALPCALTIVSQPRLCIAEIKWWAIKNEPKAGRWELRGGWRWARRNLLWELWGKLQCQWVLDRLWHLREVVPREVRKNNTGQGGKYQAVQMPFLQHQEEQAVETESRFSMA